MKRTVGRLILGVMRYRLEGEPAPTGACVLVAAPHTSWLDFPLMLGISWSSGLTPGFLAKEELFRAPFGALMRSLGGIEVDRANPGTLVADMVARARSGEPFALVIAPEGTRGSGARWKSGFYRIAQDAEVPIVLAYVDGPTRSGGFGPSIRPTGDIRADMDLIRDYYADKHGVRPDKRTEPGLREEDADPASPRGLSGPDHLVDVALLVVADCPHQDLALRNLGAALDLVGLGGTPVTQVVVTTDEQARALAFRGSPTVLLDGVDPFDPEGPESFGLSCRVYPGSTGLAGAPSVDALVAAFGADRS